VPDELTPSPREPWWSRERKPEPDAAEPDPDEHPPAGAPWLGQTEPFLRALARSLEPVEDRLTRIADAARANDADLTRVAEETRDGLQEVTRAVSEVRVAVSSSTDEVRIGAADAREAAAEARTATVAAVERLVESVEAQSSSLESLSEELVLRIDTRVTELAASVAELLDRARTDFSDALSGTAAELRTHQDQTTARLTDQVTMSTRALEEGFEQLKRLGALIEGMSTRRGFRQLVESEASLREEQAAFVAELADASRRFEARLADATGQMDELRTMLEAAARDAASMRQVPLETSDKVAEKMDEATERLSARLREMHAQDLAASTAKLRRELEQGVPVRDVLEMLERLAKTQADLAAAHRDVTMAAGTIERATDDLRRHIEGWGTPRSAPHLAQELAALDERVGAVEHRIAEDLAPAISTLVTQQVLDALEERDQDRRRGLFPKRRRGSRSTQNG
jgi:hypothetical protein